MARTAHSAIAARWRGGRISMEPAGRDRRVRSRISKRRTPGARAEDSDDAQEVEEVHASEDETAPVEEAGEPASGSAGPSRRFDLPAPAYTHSRQRSPGRKRGRLPVPGRTTLKSRTSLADILSMTPVQVGELLVQTGYCENAKQFFSLHA